MFQKLFVISCLVFVVFSFTPTLYELYYRDRLQPNRAFELVHNFPTDYNFYLSRIREGIEGRSSVVEKYTSEPHQGSFIHVFYLFLGWLGRWSRVPWERGGDVYHVARIVLACTLLMLIARFAKKSFPTAGWQFIAFLLAVTASTWPKLVYYNGGWRFGGYMPWWSVMDSLQRITFIPHLLLGQGLMLFLIGALSDVPLMQRGGNWIFLGFLAFLLGVVFPPGLIFVYAAAGILILLDIFHTYRGADWRLGSLFSRIVLPRGIICLLGLPALVYLQLMTTFYPWKRLAEFDIVKPLPFDYVEYIKAVGPVLPLGILGLLLALYRGEGRLRASVAWVTAWASLLWIFRFIPQQSPLRFSEMLPHVPLAALTVYLLSEALFFSRRFRVSGRIVWVSHESGIMNYGKRGIAFIIHNSVFIILALLLVHGVAVMYSSWLWQRDFIDHKMSAAYPLVPTGSYVMYPLKDFLSAMKFIQDATPRDTVVLSETTAGNYLPVYSGNTVYVGHANTVHAEQKEATVKTFFSGQMKPDDARGWLTRENLHYIFFGPQEKEDGGVSDLQKIYPFVVPVYQNGFVTVYQFP